MKPKQDFKCLKIALAKGNSSKRLLPPFAVKLRTKLYSPIVSASSSGIVSSYTIPLPSTEFSKRGY